MKPHPISELLPPMSADELQALAADIKAHGLHQAVVLYQGLVLDGRHRAQACQLVGVPVRTTDFAGDEAEAVAYVYSTNLARRQLSKSQLAVAGAKLKAWHALKAKERQLDALRRGNKTRHGDSPVPANLPEPAEGDARDQAAAAVGVSGKLIDQADAVMRSTVPEVAQLVERGGMTLNEASLVVSLSKETQRRIAALPTKAVRLGYLRTIMKKSTAGKKARGQRSTIVQPSDAPGTPLVRTLLSRLELLTNEIERSGHTPQKFAEQFVAEFDWGEPLLVRRLSYVTKAVEMVVTLSVMSQRARKSAA
jgi:hypothetical protein